jgi:hypothetical protein
VLHLNQYLGGASQLTSAILGAAEAWQVSAQKFHNFD